ncbi:MAG: putative 4-hydroxybenzoate polyprenyltransferase [Thermoguttaceae bacterium]|nr:putative 4-hydroxybenzoate polyprenyltransferase [Thermoguttaceae bacterium]MDW8078250.1 4-hydroxybenzoate octaprenyltransferase [Thermoguttaceae bacterium]
MAGGLTIKEIDRTEPPQVGWLRRVFLNVRYVLELIRFSHTVFALPFAFLSAGMAIRLSVAEAQGWLPPWRHLLGILLCMVFARSAAMAFNRLADRHFDSLNPRTAGRHLPRGILSVRTVALFTAACGLGFVASTLLFLPENPIPVYASLPVLAYLLGYSYTKRFTVLSHWWLGGALGLAPLGAWVALRAEIAPAAVILGLAVLFWVAGFDIIYACQDIDFDRTYGLKSLPAKLGAEQALRVAAGCHLVMILVLAILPLLYRPFGIVYYIGLGVIAVILWIEHRLVRPDDLTRVNQAFFHANAVVSVGLFLIGLADLLA